MSPYRLEDLLLRLMQPTSALDLVLPLDVSALQLQKRTLDYRQS